MSYNRCCHFVQRRAELVGKPKICTGINQFREHKTIPLSGAQFIESLKVEECFSKTCNIEHVQSAVCIVAAYELNDRPFASYSLKHANLAVVPYKTPTFN